MANAVLLFCKHIRATSVIKSPPKSIPGALVISLRALKPAKQKLRKAEEEAKRQAVAQMAKEVNDQCPVQPS